jgi:hypothetical protein
LIAEDFNMLSGIESRHRTAAHQSFAELVPHNILELLEQRPISLLPLTKELTPDAVRSRFPSGPVYVCDAYVSGVENGNELPYGYELDGIVNIDHHAPTQAMMRTVSSGNLALEFLQHHGPLTGAERVVIHHLDCDSFVSSLLIRGILKPSPIWGEIVVAADHTGAPHPVADLLQALADFRDIRLSASNLLELSLGLELDPIAQLAIASRRTQREAARQAVESGALRRTGGVTWIETGSDLDGELAVPLIPDAIVIMIAVPLRGTPDRWVNRVRLGFAAPQGLSLLDLGINEFDQAWGGRWNAGSNNRGGGSALPPIVFAELLAKKVEDWVCKQSS